MTEPVAASDVTAATPDGAPVHDVVYENHPAIPVDVNIPAGQQIVNPGTAQHPILKHFNFGHLPLHLAEVAQDFYLLAHKMHDTLPMGAETVAGLRKLLEAKDCMVRAANEQHH